jgi:hypothetical protein
MLSNCPWSLVKTAIEQPGRPLPPDWREFFEDRTGADLGQAIIHSDQAAAIATGALRAEAFAVGNHIVFGAGKYSPETSPGIWLLAHEVAHLAQPVVGGPTGALRLADPNGVWERCADAFADAVLNFEPFPLTPLSRRSDDVFMHMDPEECPKWVPVSAGPTEINLAANLAIEFKYRAARGGNIFFLGSDFDRELNPLQLSKEQAERFRKSSKDGNELVKEANDILKELFINYQRFRPTGQTLRPDIIDFSRREIYEIKTFRNATEQLPAVILQVEKYYKMANEAARLHSTPTWDPDRPFWHPPHVIQLPGDRDKVVCTSGTWYILGARDTIHRPGLILYEVLRKLTEEEQKKKAAAMQVAVIPELREIRDVVQKRFIETVQSVFETEYLIVCTQEFIDALARIREQELKEETFNKLARPAWQRSFGYQLRTVNVAMCIAMSVGYVVAIAYAVGGAAAASAAAASPAAAAPSAGATITLEQILLAARTAANDNAVRVVAKTAAAAIIPLIFAGTIRNASAHDKLITFDKRGGIYAIPRSWLRFSGPPESYSELMGADRKLFFIGRATVPPDKS